MQMSNRNLDMVLELRGKVTAGYVAHGIIVSEPEK